MSEYNVAPDKKGLSSRAVGGLIVAALVIVLIVINRDPVRLSFGFFTWDTSLWVALSIAALGGLIAGFLIGRKRYKP